MNRAVAQASRLRVRRASRSSLALAAGRRQNPQPRTAALLPSPRRNEWMHERCAEEQHTYHEPSHSIRTDGCSLVNWMAQNVAGEPTLSSF